MLYVIRKKIERYQQDVLEITERLDEQTLKGR